MNEGCLAIAGFFGLILFGLLGYMVFVAFMINAWVTGLAIGGLVIMVCLFVIFDDRDQRKWRLRR